MTEESIEDSGDKIRRNLVMVSTAVLAGAFLGVKLDGSAKLLGFVDIPNPTTWKVWLLLGLGLVYLILRYKFDELTKDLSENAERVFQERALNDVSLLLTKRIRGKVLRNSPCGWVNTERLERHIVEQARRYEQTSTHQFGAHPKPKTLECIGHFSGDVWKGKVSFGFNISPMQHSGWENSSDIDYRLPFYYVVWFFVSVWASILINTKLGIDLLLPYIFGWFALLVCAWKIAEPYFPLMGRLLIRGMVAFLR